MKAMKLVEFGKPLQMVESELLPLLDDNVLVKVEACGVCHSDLHGVDGLISDRSIRLPITLGHEVAGKVEAKGRSVTEFEVGDRVVVYPSIGCGVCRFCEAGLDNLCGKAKLLGLDIDGGYAEYVVVPNQRYIVKYDGLKPEEAGVLACSGITALQALKQAQIKPDEIVVIIGAGGLGGMAIQLAKSLTASTIVVLDIDDKKLTYARNLGADYTINPACKDVPAVLNEVFKGKRANAIIDFVGSTETIETALKIIGKGGRLVAIGLFGGLLKMQIPFLTTMAINIKGSVLGTLTDLREMIHLASRGIVKPVISASFRLDQVNEALFNLRKGEIVGRAVIKP
jgi:propanol-preferring alcohol dehydrogenase